MSKLLIISGVLFLMFGSCAPSNIKVIKTIDSAQEISVKFNGYKNVELKKISGFNSSVLYRIKELDSLHLSNELKIGIDFYISELSLSEFADLYSYISDCVLGYNQDSTILFVKGFDDGSQYSVIKKGNQDFTIFSTVFSATDSIPVPIQEMDFLEMLIRRVSVLDKQTR